MRCPKCRFDSGKEWNVLCPPCDGGCGYKLGFFQWSWQKKWPLLVWVLPAIQLIVVIFAVARGH